jgi:acetyltransferase-like isoleucine patch superfamily enzyme
MIGGIHATALVSPQARLGRNVTIGPFSIVHDNVEVGDDSIIESHCEIGYPTPRADGKVLTIGPNARIRSHSVFYEGSTFGPKLVTGHRVTAREGTVAGECLQLGTLCDIQGTCTIGDHVRFHSNVHIGQLSRIGSFVWIFPYVVLTNDPHPPSNHLVGVQVEDYAAIATMSVILPGVRIGRGALVGAHALVDKDVPADTVVAGSPAHVICATSRIKLKDGTDRPAYPWTTHFHSGYPEHIVKEWIAKIPNTGDTPTGGNDGER